jgi:hypothetical protein
MPLTDRRLPAYGEIVGAGIRAPEGEYCRFTEDGWSRLEEFLREPEERVERERLDPRDASNLFRVQIGGAPCTC